MLSIINITAANSINAIRTALKAVNADSGVKSKLNSGWKKGDVVEYAAKVAKRVEAGVEFDSATPTTIDEMIVALEAAAKPAKPAKTDDAPRCVISGRKLSARQISHSVAIARCFQIGSKLTPDTVAVDVATMKLITGMSYHRYYAVKAWTHAPEHHKPSFWNTLYVSAVRSGYAASFDADTNTVKLTKLDDEAAAANVATYIARVAEYKAHIADFRANKAQENAAA